MTIIYGASDDLIEIEGDVKGEVGCYGTDEEHTQAVLLMFSDGSLLEIKYGKAKLAIWGITVIAQGPLFERLETCSDEDADRYSDTAYFGTGLKWAYAARAWERVR